MTGSSGVERALRLAQSGQCRSVSEILRLLPAQEREAVETYLSVPNARRALILVCSNAWLAAQQQQTLRLRN